MAEQLPLAGIRVADFTQVIMGPYCTMMLGALGAEIIKVETVSRAGIGRDRGSFSSLNANKKSVTLDLKHPKALEIARQLIAVSDVSLDNFGTGVMDRLGLGYEVQRSVRPDIIMVSNTSLGRTGPLRNSIGFYVEVNAFAGFSWLTGHHDGGPGQVGGAWTDHMTGMLAVFTILSALRYRRETGKGQYIDLTMSENILATIPEPLMDYAANGRDNGPQENADPTMAPHGVYRCHGFDQWIAIAVTNEGEWTALRQVMGGPEWSHDPRFATMEQRVQHRDALDACVAAWTVEHDKYEAMHLLQRAGVPAAPVLDARGLAEDPQLQSRGYLVPLGESEGRPLSIPGLPWHLSDMPPLNYQQAPRLGEHNSYVLEELLGLSAQDVQALAAEGVLR